MIITRAGKGSELTHTELDNNLIELRDGENLMVPKTQGKGLKLGPVNSPTFGWHDIVGNLFTDPNDVGDAARAIYRGGIKALQFTVGDDAYVDFHIPHDYAIGTDIFIHVHWSHASTLVTGGSCTWGFEMLYSKGHNQGAFDAPVLVSVVQLASLVQYQHMIAETTASVAGSSPVLLNKDLLDVDGVIQCRLWLDSNDMTVSSGPVPEPFAHFVDIHYQSTSVPTKNRSPNFWG